MTTRFYLFETTSGRYAVTESAISEIEAAAIVNDGAEIVTSWEHEPSLGEQYEAANLHAFATAGLAA